jgi:diaminopimelate epimerase
MKRPFFKYHGTGNDFILIDQCEDICSLSVTDIARLCNRHLGIGADGLMLLTREKGYDFGMRYFNADGNESTMCGNGGRCITAFARALGIIGDKATFLAIDGEHNAEILHTSNNETIVRLHMSDVPLNPRMPERETPDQLVIDTGSPHLVLFVEDASLIDVATEGRKHRFAQPFSPAGINVDFVQIKQDGSLFVRTFERGVEAETLSCGTGVTAAALAMELGNLSATSFREPDSEGLNRKKRVAITTLGGHLTVAYTVTGNRFTDIRLEGPATFVYSGEFNNP